MVTGFIFYWGHIYMNVLKVCFRLRKQTFNVKTLVFNDYLSKWSIAYCASSGVNPSPFSETS